MSYKRLVIDGFGQLELNQVAFRRDGRIEAQCHLDAVDFESIPAENGMLLAVDNVTRTIKLWKSGMKLPVALNYSAEHMYDERLPGLKNFSLKRGSFLPRLGYLSVGDKFTTNCVGYDDGEWADDAALKEALKAEALQAAPVYGGLSEDGSIALSATEPSEGPVLLAVKGYSMPDGQYGIKFQVLAD